MGKNSAQDDSSSPAQGGTGKASDLLVGLEDLLAEEGLDLEGEEDEDEFSALFDDDDDDDDDASAAPVPEAPVPASKQRLDTRGARANRRSQDRDVFKNLDSQMRLDPMGIEVSEDKLTATISRITSDNSYEEILDLLSTNDVVYGVNHESIRAALSKAARGQPVYGVMVARGEPPRIVKDIDVVHRLPREMLIKSPDAKVSDFERLKQALEGPHREALHSLKLAVKVVSKGDVISELVPAEIETGTDIYGEPVSIEPKEELALDYGDNTALSEDGNQVLSEIYGFAGLIEGLPTVLPPVWISEDHMQACFVFLPSSEPIPPPTPEELQQLLELLWIEFGVMEKQLKLIPQRLAKGSSLSTTVPIAQGTTEISGENAQIQYAFDFHSILSWSQIQTLLSLPTPQEIEQTLGQLYENPETAPFTAFNAGQVVVEKAPATEGVPGKDIQGEEVIPEEGQDVEMEVGENLVLVEDDLRALSDGYGYVCLQYDIQVSLLSPLWISPEKTEVYFINLPQFGSPKYPSLEEMQELLDRLEVTNGFQAERWVEKLAELEAGTLKDFMILVAEGVPAQPGVDANFEWAVEITERKPGKVLDDGSIDFRERSLTTVVQESDLIGRLVPPEAGVPGKDVFNNQLNPPSPLNIEVVTDSRIYAEAEKDGAIKFFAEVGGGISNETKVKKTKKGSQKRIHIGIDPITNIERDVDYSTGNIDFNGDVVIGGSVQPQFSVRATGSVTIDGYVESGAYITAGKDIIIKRGVVGASTELIAGGEVMAKYIQEATVRAGGAVKVGSYIFNASVRAGGQVVVTGKGEGKSRALVGGLIWGARGIIAKSIGSPYNTSTRLVAGIDPEYVNRADQIRANMQSCEDKQRKMMKTIGVDSLDLALIKQKLARSRDPKQKKTILLCIKRVAKIADLQQNLQKELSDIAENQRKLAFMTSINVQNDIFSGVELRIGEQTLILQDDQAKVSFRLVQNDEILDIQVGPFKGFVR